MDLSIIEMIRRMFSVTKKWNNPYLLFLLGDLLHSIFNNFIYGL